MSTNLGRGESRPDEQTHEKTEWAVEGETIGTEQKRREDASLLTGRANYVDDISEPDAVYMAVLRSQFGHAEIEEINTSNALANEGVLDIFTASDVDASGIPGTIPAGSSLLKTPETTCRKDLTVPERPLLASEKARYVGEPLAVVVAEDKYTAYNTLDDIHVNCELLDATVDPLSKPEADEPPVHDVVPDNVSYDWEIGDRETVDAAFEEAAHTVRIERDRQRMIPNSIEPRGALASYDDSKGLLTIEMGTQVPYLHKLLISDVLGLEQHRIRVVAPDIGGGFGAKSKFYPEELLAGWCSMQLNRPIKWTATRSESYVSDVHGRCHSTVGELAFDDDGTILGLRVKSIKDLGAYVSRAAPIISTGSYATLLSGQYKIPNIHCQVKGVFTNTTPTDAYRGSDRPEATFIVERLFDVAARELNVDPAELRRQNFIPPDAFPYQTPVSMEYDSGEYEATLDRALEMVSYDELREEQQSLREEGRYLGIGFSCFIEKSGSPPVTSGDEESSPTPTEASRIQFHPSGAVSAFCGTSDQGQGHETTYAQIVANELGIPIEDIEIYEGDTAQLPHGTGAFSSRSTIMAGNSLVKSAAKIIDQARAIAAVHFSVKPARVSFADGLFSVPESDTDPINIQTVARWAYRARNLPEHAEPGLEATTFYTSEGFTFPYGTHVAVVEVETDTGDIDIRRYVAVDDVGNQINPGIVEGQIVGGVVQGIGQALHEEAIYDRNATLETSTFKDYSVPRADDVPVIEADTIETPSPRNPLGVKGAGESGTIGAPVAVVNAVVDALAPFDVNHLDMPIAPEDVWEIISSGHEQA